MINYREILRLHSLGYSQRRIESSVRSSHQTVKSVLEKAKAQGISWPLEDDVTNAMLDELLSGKEQKGVSPYAEPDFAYIHKELSKKGITLEKDKGTSVRPFVFIVIVILLVHDANLP